MISARDLRTADLSVKDANALLNEHKGCIISNIILKRIILFWIIAGKCVTLRSKAMNYG